MKSVQMCNNFQRLDQEIHLSQVCSEMWWLLNVTWFNLRPVSAVMCQCVAWKWSRNTTESWSGAWQRNPAEPSACRHFTQTSESVSAQFSPGDSGEWFLQGLTIHRQVANYHRSTMRQWRFIIQQSHGCRKTSVTKTTVGAVALAVLLFLYTLEKCENPSSLCSNQNLLHRRRTQHLERYRCAQKAFVLRGV